MAKEIPEWAKMQAAEDMISKIIDNYPEKFPHIDQNLIGCAVITNKEQSKNADWDAKIIGVTQPAALFCSKTYVIYFHMATWEKYTEVERAFMLIEQLLKIPDEFDGSLGKEDLKAHKCLIKKFGLDYKNPNSPNVLQEKIDF